MGSSTATAGRLCPGCLPSTQPSPASPLLPRALQVPQTRQGHGKGSWASPAGGTRRVPVQRGAFSAFSGGCPRRSPPREQPGLPAPTPAQQLAPRATSDSPPEHRGKWSCAGKEPPAGTVVLGMPPRGHPTPGPRHARDTCLLARSSSSSRAQTAWRRPGKALAPAPTAPLSVQPHLEGSRAAAGDSDSPRPLPGPALPAPGPAPGPAPSQGWSPPPGRSAGIPSAPGRPWAERAASQAKQEQRGGSDHQAWASAWHRSPRQGEAQVVRGLPQPLAAPWVPGGYRSSARPCQPAPPRGGGSHVKTQLWCNSDGTRQAGHKHLGVGAGHGAARHGAMPRLCPMAQCVPSVLQR